MAINTFHPCETAVMKPFALPVLETLTEKTEYTETVRRAVEEFYSVSEAQVRAAVSCDSLLREFIPQNKN